MNFSLSLIASSYWPSLNRARPRLLYATSDFGAALIARENAVTASLYLADLYNLTPSLKASCASAARERRGVSKKNKRIARPAVRNCKFRMTIDLTHGGCEVHVPSPGFTPRQNFQKGIKN